MVGGPWAGSPPGPAERLWPPGVRFSPIEFGNMQKINKPEEVCDGPQEVPTPPSCSEHVSRWPLGGRGLWEQSPHLPPELCPLASAGDPAPALGGGGEEAVSSPACCPPARRVREAADGRGLRGLPGPGAAGAARAGLHAGPLPVPARHLLRLQHHRRVLPPVFPCRGQAAELEDRLALP